MARRTRIANLKQSKSIYILTQWKDNLAPLTDIPRPIDRANPANALTFTSQRQGVLGGPVGGCGAGPA